MISTDEIYFSRKTKYKKKITEALKNRPHNKKDKFQKRRSIQIHIKFRNTTKWIK